MKIYIIPILIFFTICAVGCITRGNKYLTKENGLRKSIQITEYEQELYGTYQGVMPCENFTGKIVSLILNSDSSYVLEYSYMENKKGIFKEQGTYRILHDTLIETTVTSTNIKSYFVYVHGNLVQSDSLGYIETTNFPEQYTLEKTIQNEG